MTVVKVGGSLFDFPALRQRLAEFFEARTGVFHLIPGGGAAADAVREWDRIHSLGDETCHWLAVRAMSLAGAFLESFIDDPRAAVVDVEPWLREHDTIPHSWDVTSDSIAAHYAIEMNASRLILLKSVGESGEGIVDGYFPVIAARLQCPFEIVNLRAT